MASDWVIRPFEHYPDMLFMVLPPGAFIGLGLLIALKNGIDNHMAERRKAAQPETVSAGSKRVRVTSNIS
jgi:electron transport complex protein RnfE